MIKGYSISISEFASKMHVFLIFNIHTYVHFSNIVHNTTVFHKIFLAQPSFCIKFFSNQLWQFKLKTHYKDLKEFIMVSNIPQVINSSFYFRPSLFLCLFFLLETRVQKAQISPQFILKLWWPIKSLFNWLNSSVARLGSEVNTLHSFYQILTTSGF